MRAPAAAVAALQQAVSGAALAPAPVLNAVWLDAPGDAGAVCNDGSRAAFYYRAATAPEQQNDWLVYLPGGHWCWDEASCAARSTSQRDLMSSAAWPENRSLDGVFRSGPLAGAHLVWVGYCSSDLYLGDRAASAATWGWHLRGERIVRATFRRLAALGLGAAPAASRVVVGGASAGARGALAWLDTVPSLVPRGVHVLGFIDTPHPFHAFRPRLGSGRVGDYSPANTLAIIDMLRPGVAKFLPRAACPTPGEEWKCLYAEYRLPTSSAEYMLVAPRFDHSIETDLADPGGVGNLSAAELAYAAQWGDDVARVLAALPAPGARALLYSPACYQPGCASGKAGFYTGELGVAGTTQADALALFLSTNRTARVGDACRGFNCGARCDPVAA